MHIAAALEHGIGLCRSTTRPTLLHGERHPHACTHMCTHTPFPFCTAQAAPPCSPDPQPPTKALRSTDGAPTAQRAMAFDKPGAHGTAQGAQVRVEGLHAQVHVLVCVRMCVYACMCVCVRMNSCEPQNGECHLQSSLEACPGCQLLMHTG